MHSPFLLKTVQTTLSYPRHYTFQWEGMVINSISKASPIICVRDEKLCFHTTLKGLLPGRQAQTEGSLEMGTIQR